MNLKSTVKKIKNLEIQGAEKIALTSANMIKFLAKKQSYNQLLNAKEQLLKARPTEPCTYNTLRFIFSNTKSPEQIIKNADAVIKHFKDTREIIARTAAQKISSRDIVFTHCHSSTVVDVLKRAKKQGKYFKVYVTETRPLFQGRTTAKELVNVGIKTTLFVDAAARLALKDADLMLIGADAITSEGKVINKIGSEMFAEIANKYGVEVFVCSDSWKFDPNTVFEEIKIEQRLRKEIWKEAPRNLNISNYTFELINPNLITAIISEIGILSPEVFVTEMLTKHKWL